MVGAAGGMSFRARLPATTAQPDLREAEEHARIHLPNENGRIGRDRNVVVDEAAEGHVGSTQDPQHVRFAQQKTLVITLQRRLNGSERAGRVADSAHNDSLDGSPHFPIPIPDHPTVVTAFDQVAVNCQSAHSLAGACTDANAVPQEICHLRA